MFFVVDRKFLNLFEFNMLFLKFILSLVNSFFMWELLVMLIFKGVLILWDMFVIKLFIVLIFLDLMIFFCVNLSCLMVLDFLLCIWERCKEYLCIEKIKNVIIVDSSGIIRY